MEAWNEINIIDKIEPNILYPVTVQNQELIFLLDSNGTYQCYQDLCSHQKIRLSEFGEIDENGEIICFAHGARFCSKSGEPTCLPAINSIKKYPVQTKDGKIFVLLK